MLSTFAPLLFAGCPRAESVSTTPAVRPFAGVKLTLLVVDDPDLSDAVKRYQTEWTARTGAEFSLQQTTTAELLRNPALAADAVIYPAGLIGTLHGGFKPLPAELRHDPTLAWNDLLEAIRQGEATWGSEVLAVPFGSPVFLCYYRSDLFEKFGKQPPATWSEFQQLAEFFQDRANLQEAAPPEGSPWAGSLEPLAPGWAGLMLLARAAPYAKHPDYYSALFDMDDMQPLIAGPPFVRALEELASAAKPRPAEQRLIAPDVVRAAVHRGETALAITWPSAGKNAAGEASKSAEATARLPVAFCELPAADEVYNLNDKSWKDYSDAPHRVPLLSIAGRLGSVSSQCKYPEAAFQLLIALSGKEWDSQVCAESNATTIFRRSQQGEARSWVEKPLPPGAADAYAKLIAESLARQETLSALPLPGRSLYLEALDHAVQAAIDDQATPQQALTACAARWNEITDRLGREQQRRVYGFSINRGGN